ncbi:aspartyl protease family protein [Sphingosinicella sp. CPCC 101087]|uniref:aspartyl protease family protein n=1 Tax=Sphingosinicella sp. CPCC 101087 TaxID=2497754 RepID=UPI00101D039C|nr:aspartyl protease family protein [Sphingosinicella sp. CPCC 101087]
MRPSLVGSLAAVLLALAPAPAAAEPLELFNNRLFLPVTVNGKAALGLLDSGAEMTVLDDDFAGRLGVAATGGATARGSGAETMEARFVESVVIEAVGASLAQPAAVLDLGEVSQRLIGRPIDLILGRELFDRHRLRIDIEAGTIDRIEDNVQPVGTRLAVGEHRGIPTFAVSIESQAPVQAAFDLGNGSEVLIGRNYAERIGLTAPERIVERRAGGGLGGPVERDIVMLRNLRIAGSEYRDVPAAIDAGESAADLNIGTSILRDFIITTDFAGGAVWLQPRNGRQ